MHIGVSRVVPSVSVIRTLIGAAPPSMTTTPSFGGGSGTMAVAATSPRVRPTIEAAASVIARQRCLLYTSVQGRGCSDASELGASEMMDASEVTLHPAT